jgi:hypothetical protein
LRNLIFSRRLERLAAVVLVVGPDAHLFVRTRPVVVGGEDRRRRADLIHQGHRKQRLAVSAGGEVHAIEIGKGRKDALYLVAMAA